jgi:hypothetical protein
LIEETLIGCSNKPISEIAIRGVHLILNYLQIEKHIIDSSIIYENTQLKSTNRVVDVCCKEHATTYVNLMGGIGLYTASEFNEKNIELNFLQPALSPYKQFKNEFVPGLSIIDVLMFNPKDWVVEELSKGKILHAK